MYLQLQWSMYVYVHCLYRVMMLPSVAVFYLKVWSFASSFSGHIQLETPYAFHQAAPSHHINQIKQSVNLKWTKNDSANQSFICLYLATHFIQIVEFLNMSVQLCKQLFTYNLTVFEPLAGTNLPVQVLQKHIHWHMVILMHMNYDAGSGHDLDLLKPPFMKSFHMN